MNKQKGELLLLAAALLGGGGFISIKYLLEWGFQPFQVIAGRFLVGGCLLFAIYFKAMKGTTKQDWKCGVLLGVLLFILFAFLTIGLRFTTPSVSAFLGNAQAIMAPFLCWLIYKKKPDGYCFFAAFITVIGVGLLSLGPDFTIGLGAVLSLLASLAFALQMVVLERVAKECNPIRLALIEHLTVAVLALAAAFVWEGKPPAITAASSTIFLFLSIFCTGLYFTFQCIGQKYTTASNTAIIITSESVFGALAAAFIYGEHLSLRGISGCVLIFAAIILAVKKPALKHNVPQYRVDDE